MAIYLAILSIARELEAYNKFQSGFVRTVFVVSFGQGNRGLGPIARSYASGLIVADCTSLHN